MCKCRVDMILPGLLNLTWRFSPALFIHQPCIELTYGPPQSRKSIKVPTVTVIHTGRMKVLDRTYPAVKRDADMVQLQWSANYPVPWKVLLQLFYPWRPIATSLGARIAINWRGLEFKKQKKKKSVKTMVRRVDRVSSSALHRIPSDWEWAG